MPIYAYDREKLIIFISYGVEMMKVKNSVEQSNMLINNDWRIE